MTVNEVQNLIYYIDKNTTKHAVDIYDENENEFGHRIDIEFNEVMSLLEKYAKTESEKTCGPNYEDMYNRTLDTLEEHRDQIRNLEKNIAELENIIEVCRAKETYYRGAIEMVELLTGRRMGFNECGGTR